MKLVPGCQYWIPGIQMKKRQMSKFTFAIALTNFTGSFGTNWPVALAATFMTILPGIVIYILGQKSFVEGIVLTGMKN